MGNRMSGRKSSGNIRENLSPKSFMRRSPAQGESGLAEVREIWYTDNINSTVSAFVKKSKQKKGVDRCWKG